MFLGAFVHPKAAVLLQGVPLTHVRDGCDPLPALAVQGEAGLERDLSSDD